MTNGKIVQIIGSVIDVEFPREGIPAVYEALHLERQVLVHELQRNWATASCARLRWAPPRA